MFTNIKRNFPEIISPKKCRGKLVTVTNQAVPRVPLTSYPYSQEKNFFLLNQLKVSTITNLVEVFKSETLSQKIFILERRVSGMHLRNGNEPKRKENKNLFA